MSLLRVPHPPPWAVSYRTTAYLFHKIIISSFLIQLLFLPPPVMQRRQEVVRNLWVNASSSLLRIGCVVEIPNVLSDVQVNSRVERRIYDAWRWAIFRIGYFIYLSLYFHIYIFRVSTFAVCRWCNLGVSSVTARPKMWSKYPTRNFCADFFLCSLNSMWIFCHQVVSTEFACSPTRSCSLTNLCLFSCLHLTNVIRIGNIMHISFVQPNQNTLWSFVRFTGKWTLKFIFSDAICPMECVSDAAHCSYAQPSKHTRERLEAI